MKNEDKAMEILGCPCYVKRVCKSHPTLCDNCEEKRDLLQMAQWKDEQFAKQMTDDEERKRHIKMIFAFLRGIKNKADYMTSGNYMHNTYSIKNSVEIIISRLGMIGITDPEEKQNDK